MIPRLLVALAVLLAAAPAAAQVTITVRERVAVLCPARPAALQLQEDGTYLRVRTTTRSPGPCYQETERRERWSAAPEAGGRFERLLEERDRVIDESTPR
jgi:hypothetical protein